MKKSYKGAHGTLHFDGSKCIHTRMCVMNLPSIFHAGEKGDWIHMDDARTQDIIEAAHNCASGAITYTLNDGQEDENPQKNAAYIRENGPIAIKGELSIDGEEQPKRLTLCRCGQSQNKPYCDGAHVKAKFTATGEPATKPIEQFEGIDGPLNITPAPDGPLIVDGNLEICSGTGRAIARTQKTALCRCGHSKNKPYCDGSHVAAGFKS